MNNEKGKIYTLNVYLAKGTNKNGKTYYALREQETDTIITFDTQTITKVTGLSYFEFGKVAYYKPNKEVK